MINLEETRYIKEQVAMYGFGTYELKLYRLAKSGGKTMRLLFENLGS